MSEWPQPILPAEPAPDPDVEIPDLDISKEAKDAYRPENEDGKDSS